MDVRELSSLLIDTQKAHHKYEVENFPKEGDKNWADWYARYMLSKMNGNNREVARNDAAVHGGDIAG